MIGWQKSLSRKINVLTQLAVLPLLLTNYVLEFLLSSLKNRFATEERVDLFISAHSQAHLEETGASGENPEFGQSDDWLSPYK